MASTTNPGVLQPIESTSRTISVSSQRLSRPRLAKGIELVGRMQDTAFDDDKYLICFDGANYIQATPVLYHVLLFADGHRTTEEIAELVREELQMSITGEEVDWLVHNRLVTSGLLDLELNDSDSEAALKPAEMPVLGIRWRIPLLPYRWTVPFADLFQHLFYPPIMIAVTIAAIAINVWIFTSGDLIRSIEMVMFRPEMVLAFIALDVLSTLFHEFGHAAALRRAGARYGWIGFAIYVIFPVLYTDVTHVYRLNRRDRIRVDLGGMYFQLVITILFWAWYQATGNGVFLLAIVFTTLSFLQQFTPFLRFDGYYTVADIIGVHEPLSIVAPFIRDRIPWPRDRKPSLPAMRLTARIALSVYLLAIIAFLAYPFLIGAFAGREFAVHLLDSGRYFWQEFVSALGNGDVLVVIVSLLQLITWVLIPLGLTLFAMTLIRHFGRAGSALGSVIWQRISRRQAPHGQETS